MNVFKRFHWIPVFTALLCLGILVSTALTFIGLAALPEKEAPEKEPEAPVHSLPESPEQSVKNPSNEPLETPEAPEAPEVPLTEVWYYNGIRLGNKAEGDSKDGLLSAAKALLDEEYVIDGTLTVVKERSDLPPLTLEEAAERIAKAVSAEYTRGWALYINDLLFAVSEEKNTLEKAVARFLDEQKLASNQHCELRGVAFLADVAAKKTALMGENEVLALLNLCGDLTVERLPGVNYDTVDRFLEGNELPHIAPVIVTEEEIVLNEILPFATVEKTDASLYEGTRILSQTGCDGEKKLTYKVIYENGVEVSRVLVASEILLAPTDEIYLVGAMKKGTATGTLLWPTKEGYISSRYGYRYLFEEYKLHGGLDIAISTGTKLYAADGGTVVQAGDAGNTYGIYVIIDHGNGMRTLYAHMSSVSVKKGDLVNQGDLIGKSGATGRVTGTHLHFEVRIDGERVNPEKYLPKTR
jgi:murein DD-endopeptidase MepM/ murein hydrolase activator NlpD